MVRRLRRGEKLSTHQSAAVASHLLCARMPGQHQQHDGTPADLINNETYGLKAKAPPNGRTAVDST